MLSLTGALAPWHAWAGRAANAREYHVSLSPQAVLDDPDFPAMLVRAGVSCVWLDSYFYGYWPWPIKTLVRAREALRLAGLDANIINVPLGHPGDSLGALDGNFPLTPPGHWHLGSNCDGGTYAGTSLHSPATDENAGALRQLRRAGFSHFFLDDDFRLARGPGEIGGCFCGEHRLRFLRHAGLPDSRWPELLENVRSRQFTSLLRQWIEFTCDDLTGSFRAQQKAGPKGKLVQNDVVALDPAARKRRCARNQGPGPRGLKRLCDFVPGEVGFSQEPQGGRARRFALQEPFKQEHGVVRASFFQAQPGHVGRYRDCFHAVQPSGAHV